MAVINHSPEIFASSELEAVLVCEALEPVAATAVCFLLLDDEELDDCKVEQPVRVIAASAIATEYPTVFLFIYSILVKFKI